MNQKRKRSRWIVIAVGAGALALAAVAIILRPFTHDMAPDAAHSASPAPCAYISQPSMPLPQSDARAGNPLMPECQAVALAQGDAVVTEPTRAQLMTAQQANDLYGAGVTVTIPSTEPVWVVTVHSPMTTFGSPMTAAVTLPVYTMFIDAYTTDGLGTAIGLDALT
ncbi:hypothetical protein [Subtercola sp. YIM 133946]|uniref:hypothetical protein n=1 Tax=Subtercola sp. YIM 133946 TaxID=3118909 RepID=UPI002F924CC1